MKLSIIVPAYNVERFLKRCVDSCQRQNINKSDYEVIIVNDGSTDNTLNIANELTCEYENVKVITQENKGLSGARNTGIDNALGDYLWFVDGDDYVKDNVLSQMLQVVFEDNLDICVFDAEVQHKDGKAHIDKHDKLYNLGVISGAEAMLTTHNVFKVWEIIYNRVFLFDNNLRFAIGLIHEDIEFELRVFYFVKRMRYVPLCCYEYCYNEGSLSRPKEIGKIQRNFYHDLLVMSNIHRFVEEQMDMGKELKLFYEKRINSVVCGVIISCLFSTQIEVSFLQKCITFCKAEGLYPLKGKTESWKTTLLSKILNSERLLLLCKNITSWRINRYK